MGVSFNVIIFGMNGECYDDDAAVQEFHTAGYDQRSFSTSFGDETTDAVQGLYLRSVAHRGDAGYDGSTGNVTSWSHRTNNHMVSAVDWDSVLADREVPSRNGGAPRLNKVHGAITTTYPMSIAGATLDYDTTSVDTQLDTPLPTLPISKITLALQRDRLRKLKVGETDPIWSYRVHAKDSEDVDYYGFVQNSGEWRVVDKTGKECKSKVVSIDTDPVTHEQRVIAKKAGKAYAKYFIPEDTYVDCNGNVSSNENIESVAYLYEVVDADLEPFSGSIKLEGSPQVTVGVQENLNAIEGLVATVYDATGKEVGRTPGWEAQELESKGIKVSTNGTFVATTPGTFHVRAFIDGVYSDWVEVTAIDAAPDPLATVRTVNPEETADANPTGELATDTPVSAGEADASSLPVPDGEAVEESDAAGPSDSAATSDEGDDGSIASENDNIASETQAGLITVLTDITRYGIDHGFIKGTSKEAMSKDDFDIMGILFVVADDRGLIPQDVEDQVGAWAHKTYSDDALASWRQHALSILLEHGYIPQGTTSSVEFGDAANGA